MQNRDSLVDWAIPCGTWSGVRLRLSPLFPIVVLILGLQRWDARLAVLLGVCLLFAVLVHALAHLFAVRLTGGLANEVLLWPLGGVTRIVPVAPPMAPVATALAGPLTNLAVAAACLPFVVRDGTGLEILDPLVLPAVDFEADMAGGLVAFLFYANWLVFAANLLPAPPLACGRIVETVAAGRLGPMLAQQTLFRLGMAVGVMLVVTALLTESVWLSALGAGLLAYNFRESIRYQMSESYDESFMGYDFSQGYTSLEKSAPPEPAGKPGFFRRWMSRRRLVKEERRRAKAKEAERELDFLLAKVHTYGIDSLTESEKRILKRASARYKGRTKS
jgi:stage IV sporulation protein FB